MTRSNTELVREALEHLESFRARVFGSEWRVMWATRNRIAHGYTQIDLDMIRSTVNRDVPQLERSLRDEID